MPRDPQTNSPAAAPYPDKASIQLEFRSRQIWLDNRCFSSQRAWVQRAILLYLTQARAQDLALGRAASLARFHSIERMCRSLHHQGLIQSSSAESLRRSLNRLRLRASIWLNPEISDPRSELRVLIEARNNYGYRLHPAVVIWPQTTRRSTHSALRQVEWRQY